MIEASSKLSILMQKIDWSSITYILKVGTAKVDWMDDLNERTGAHEQAHTEAQLRMRETARYWTVSIFISGTELRWL